MARRHNDDADKGPWPPGLAEFDPKKWANRRAWHAARAKVARALGRPVLPEVRAMTKVHRGRNGKVL